MFEKYRPFTVDSLRLAGEADGTADATCSIDQGIRRRTCPSSHVSAEDIDRRPPRDSSDHIDKWARWVEKAIRRRTSLLLSMGAPRAAVDAYRVAHEAAWGEAFQAFTDECRRREQIASLVIAGIMRPSGHALRDPS